jgi:hypothetical protein
MEYTYISATLYTVEVCKMRFHNIQKNVVVTRTFMILKQTVRTKVFETCTENNEFKKGYQPRNTVEPHIYTFLGIDKIV